MKRKFTILVALMGFLAMGLLTTSCTKESLLKGDWKMTSTNNDGDESMIGSTWSFDDDGDLFIMMEGYTIPKGYWDLDGDNLSIRVGDTWLYFEVDEISSKNLKINYSENTHYYIRFKKK